MKSLAHDGLTFQQYLWLRYATTAVSIKSFDRLNKKEIAAILVRKISDHELRVVYNFHVCFL